MGAIFDRLWIPLLGSAPVATTDFVIALGLHAGPPPRWCILVNDTALRCWGFVRLIDQRTGGHPVSHWMLSGPPYSLSLGYGASDFKRGSTRI